MSLIKTAQEQADILIVEDDAAILREMADTVQGFGYSKIRAVTTVNEALCLAADNPPDLALVDIRLKGKMAGIELATQLRRLYEVPVIFITAYGDDETLDEANAAVPYAFLLKPVSDRELHQAIRIALRLSRAEAKLRESNRHLEHSRSQWQNTLHDLPGLVFARKANGTIGLWNHACNALLGYQLEDIQQSKHLLTDLFGGQLPFEETVRTSNTQFDNRVYTMRTRNGKERHVRWTGIASQPEITGWSEIYFGIDLTIEMRIRTELWRSSFRYLQLVETIPHAIAEIDGHGYFTFANQALYDLLGLQDTQVLQKHIDTSLQFERLKGLRETLKRMLMKKRTASRNASVYCRDKNNRALYLDLSITRSAPESGHEPCAVLIITNVTQAEATRRELMKSEKRYRIISELSSDFAFSYKATSEGTNRYLWATDAIETVTGYSFAEIQAKDNLDALLPREEDRDKLAQHRRELFKGKTASGTILIRRKDGDLRWLTILSYPQYCLLDRSLVVIGAARDITESKQAREDIARLSQYIIQAQETEQRRMAFELHDHVAQDLAALRINWELISEAVQKNTDGSNTEKIQRFSDLLTRCIQTVRNLSYDLSPAGIEEQTIDKIISDLAVEFQEQHKIKIHTQFAGTEDVQPSEDININLFRITQETLNNIRKHAKASRVDIKIIATPRLLALDIQDNGCGFAVEAAKKRAIQTRHMGLFSIQQRASLIGGKAIIRSHTEKGTRVRIEIPLK